jgi:phosphoribosylamine--glycine ligase
VALAGQANPVVPEEHALRMHDGDTVTTSGGRVLCVTALGDSLKQAQRAAYAAIPAIRFRGMQFRRDIGFRALTRTP